MRLSRWSFIPGKPTPRGHRQIAFCAETGDIFFVGGENFFFDLAHYL
jgi:hypothetical protein